jgi:molecular chaperone GrpE (heat shock protein)
MATQTKEGKAHNKMLLQMYKSAQASADNYRAETEQVIKEALFNGKGITEDVMRTIANISRSFDMANDRAEQTWGRYHDHCTTWDYDIQY